MRKKSIVGLVTFAVGLVLMGGSGLVVSSATERNASFEAVALESETRCRQEVSKIAAFVPQHDGIVDVVLSDVSDPQSAMADVTAVLAMCPHRRLVAACFGTTCGPEGTPSPMRAVVTLQGSPDL